MKRILCAALFISCSFATQAAVTIPFELVNKNVFIRVQAGRSAPLSFVLDTGDKYAVIDLAVAKSLGLNMATEVPVGGAGKNVITGWLLKDSPFRVTGLRDFEQPLFIAVPLDDLARASGHPFDGTLGYDFISRFVVEIDYVARRLILHDKDTFEYRGAGEILPITFNAAGHPQVRAQLIDGGRAIDGTFVLDIGSGAAVMLNTPFVGEQHLLAGRKTVPWMEGRGFGGGIDGSVGRVEALKLGSFRIDAPVVVFTRAEAGPFASTEAQGNIGAGIIEKFKLILDYARNRIILEPNARFREPIEYNRSGLSLTAEGAHYETIRIAAAAADSPASDAGLQAGDVIKQIDGKPASQFTLTQIRRMFVDANECRLTVARGAKTFEAVLKLRRRV